MSPEKFDRLTENVRKNQRLESLPLCVIAKNPAGNEEFHILSGHHRLRAARSAGLRDVYVMVIEEPLTRNQVVAKQLSHNSLTGYDDPTLLRELYSEMEDINAKLESGITDIDLNVEMPSISADDLKFDFDYELLQIFFLPKQKEKFEEVVKLIEKDAEVYLADKADFERMKNVMIKISQKENIRNVAAIFSRMVELTENYLKNSGHGNG